MRIVAELGLDANNKITALKLRWNANLGAYCSGRSGWPVGNVGGIAGTYIIPAISAEVCGILTHTVPTAAYRGAGRPEATYAIERLIDVAARERGISPYELRRINLIPPEAMPYKTALTFLYDCGEFEGNMIKAAELAELESFEDRRGEAEIPRQAARHRPDQLHRGRRRPIPASREGSFDVALRRGRQTDLALRLDVGWPGTGNRVLPDRLRTVRRTAGECALRTRRHRSIAVGQRQRRLRRAVHRRLRGHAGGGQGDRAGEETRRRTAGSVGHRHRTARGQVPHRRHRSIRSMSRASAVPPSIRTSFRRARKAA